MASRVLTARNPIRPGTPPTAPHTSAPTTASEVFSATDSTTARAIPSASRACGSRPHRCGSRSRAASTSPASSARPMTRASRTSELPPTTAQVAAETRATVAAGERRTARSATAPRATTPPAAHDGVQGSAAPVVPPQQPLDGTGGPPERGDGMPSAGIAEQQVAQKAGGGAVRVEAIGTHRLSRPWGRAATWCCTSTAERAWRYVLTQGVHALVRRDRRREFLAPGGSYPGHSGGTAPDSHRLPLLLPYMARAVHHGPQEPSTCL